MKKIKIGIIGCGTIGTELALFVHHALKSWAKLSYICDSRPEKAHALLDKLKTKTSIVSWNELVRSSDVIVESASAAISGRVASECLKRRKPVMIMSAGGLLPIAAKVMHARYRERLYVPSGAIAGIDALFAAQEGRIEEVKLITRKPPLGLQDAPYFNSHPFPDLGPTEEARLFQGQAAQAVKGFPQNINVAAVLSLFGIGAEQTLVEIWTSRLYTKNQHEVLIRGDFGTIRATSVNVPAPGNPKTSYLAVLSAKSLLRRIVERRVHAKS